MSFNMLKVFIFAIFMFLTILTGSVRALAQDDSSDEQAREQSTQETLNQIHDLEAKMQDTGKQLDALEKAVNQSDTEVLANTDTEAPVKQAPVQEVAAAPAVPVEKVAEQEAPVQAPVVVPPPQESPVVPAASQIYNAPIPSVRKEHTFEISPETFYSSFKESGNYSVYKKSGEFYGINAAYTYRPLDAELYPINVFHLEVHGDYGLMDYNYQGDKINSVNNYMVEPRAWLGKDLDFGELTSLTPYVGVGYRWYFDQLKKKTDDAGDGGFDVQDQYVYIPVGAELSLHPVDGWRITLNGEYDFLAWGRVNNYISQYFPAVSNLNNTLKGGYGLRGSVKIMKEGDTFNYFVEPYITYWQINASKTSDILVLGQPSGISYQEDKNHTTEIGARLGVEF